MSTLVFIENHRPVTDSLTVAETFGKRHADVMRDIRNLECSEEFNQRNFAQVDYVDSGGRTYQKYLIAQDGFAFLVMGYTGKEAARFKEMYINEFNRMREQLQTQVAAPSYMIEDPIARAERWIAEEKERRALRLENEERQKEIEYKEEVIIGLVDEIDLATKRQVLNRVVRHKGAQYQERWRELYKQFEMKYHTNLNRNLERYNDQNKPKLKNKVDYIDKVMRKIPELYEIACKLFENDVKELVEEIYTLKR